MEVKINSNQVNGEIAKVLLDHFKYSIKDIRSYDELTAEEKKIIPIDVFDKIVRNSE